MNVKAVINGIRTFVPLLTEQGSGHVSATSSLSGLVGDPGLLIYNGTKFAVAGMMEALALELGQLGSGVSCSVVCPGPVATDLMTTSDNNLVEAGSVDQLSGETATNLARYLAAGLDPDEVGRITLNGISAGHFWILTHPDYTFEIMDPRYEAMKRGDLFTPAEDWADHR